MKRDSLVFINHIRDEIDKIIKSMNNITKNKFKKDNLLKDATIRRIEIIGEAIKNIPSEFRKKYPNVEWKGIAGIRDKMIHYYFGVDFKTVWDVIKQDIPKLKIQIKEIINKEKNK